MRHIDDAPDRADVENTTGLIEQDVTRAEPSMRTTHEHESWMIQASAKGGHYCAACGQTVERVVIPAVDGLRNIDVPATVVRPDPDNSGHVIVCTDRRVMGERYHALPAADLQPLRGDV